MVQISEWIKGITFTIFGIILFYFYWDNIFLGMINFIGNFEISGITDATSISILKTISWVSFAILFLVSVPIFGFYTIINGSKDENKTNPIEIIKGIGTWLILTPIGLIIYVLIASLTTSLSSFDVGTGVATASNFSWLIGLICIGGTNLVPYYYILKGYGQLGDKIGIQ